MLQSLEDLRTEQKLNLLTQDYNFHVRADANQVEVGYFVAICSLVWTLHGKNFNQGLSVWYVEKKSILKGSIHVNIAAANWRLESYKLLWLTITDIEQLGICQCAIDVVAPRKSKILTFDSR